MKRLVKLISLLALAFGLLVVHSAPDAGAQGTESATAAPAKKPIPAGFEPIAGREAQAEAVSAPMLVVLAYGAFFLLTFGYVVHVTRRQKALSDELEALKTKVGRGGGGA